MFGEGWGALPNPHEWLYGSPSKSGEICKTSNEELKRSYTEDRVGEEKEEGEDEGVKKQRLEGKTREAKLSRALKVEPVTSMEHQMKDQTLWSLEILQSMNDIQGNKIKALEESEVGLKEKVKELQEDLGLLNGDKIGKMQKIKDRLQVFMKIREDEKEDAKKSEIGLSKTVAELAAQLMLVKVERDSIEKERDDYYEELTNIKQKHNLQTKKIEEISLESTSHLNGMVALKSLLNKQNIHIKSMKQKKEIIVKQHADAIMELKQVNDSLIKEHEALEEKYKIHNTTLLNEKENVTKKLNEKNCCIVKEYKDHINMLKQEKETRETFYEISNREQNAIIEELRLANESHFKESEDTIKLLNVGKAALIKEHNDDTLKLRLDKDTLIKSHNNMVEEIVKKYEQTIKAEETRRLSEVKKEVDNFKQLERQMEGEAKQLKEIAQKFEKQLSKQTEESKQLKQTVSLRTSEQQREVEALRERICQSDREATMNETFLEESKGEMRSRDKIIRELRKKLMFKQ